MINRTATVLSIVAVLCLLLAILTICHQRDKAREAKDGQTVAEGRTESAVEAITEIGRLNERGRASDKEVNDAQEAIRKADPTDRDRIARYRLCLLQHRTDCERMQ